VSERGPIWPSCVKTLFPEILVVTHESCRAEMQALPKKYALDVALDVVCFPKVGNADLQEEQGTADALRLLGDRLTCQRLAVVSCDLVCDVPVQQLTDLHRVKEASATMLLSRVPQVSTPAVVPGPKVKPKKGESGHSSCRQFAGSSFRA